MPTQKVDVKPPLLAELFLGLVLVLSSGCFVSRDEVARVISPSNKVDAVLVEVNGGATTRFAYDIFVVPTGASTLWRKRVAHLYDAARNGQAAGANLKWTTPSQLSVEYLYATEESLVIPRIGLAGTEVSISLHSGVEDPDAPPGGMLYNLEGRPYDK